jgi:type II secretory pathway predicted ATPase ExeA
MIRAFYGITEYPFASETADLLLQQQEIYETLRVHCQQGGLCLVLGIPGTGKTRIKEVLKRQADHKRMLVVTVARTLHTYTNTIRILCDAFSIEYDGSHFKCERRLIEEAHALNRQGKMLVIVIDDAHLLDLQTFRKLRLLFEDFPKNHNVILIGQPQLLGNIALAVNEDIKSRVTYSVIMPRLNPDDMRSFILGQLDRAGLGHNTLTGNALDLIVRSSDGVLRKARNLCLSCLLEGLRARTKTIDLDQVNRVLIQPHWRNERDFEQF